MKRFRRHFSGIAVTATSVTRPLRRRSLVLAAATALGVSGIATAPALAATTLSAGTGAFTATSAINPTVPPPCASYGNYEATLEFPSATFGNYSGPLTVNVKSTPGQYWGENPDGTYLPVVSDPLDTECKQDAPPEAIPGFSGTVIGTNGSQTVACELSAGTHRRNGTRSGEEGLDLTFTFNQVSGDCDGATTPVTVKTSIVLAPTPWGTACVSPIAPPSCELGPARF